MGADGAPKPRNYRMTVCTYWLRGLCMKGDTCGFLHQFDPERMPVCRTLLKFGVCKEPGGCLLEGVLEACPGWALNWSGCRLPVSLPALTSCPARSSTPFLPCLSFLPCPSCPPPIALPPVLPALPQLPFCPPAAGSAM